MYTHSMETIYLSLSEQVAVGTFFMKSPVAEYILYINVIYALWIIFLHPLKATSNMFFPSVYIDTSPRYEKTLDICDNSLFLPYYQEI